MLRLSTLATGRRTLALFGVWVLFQFAFAAAAATSPPAAPPDLLFFASPTRLIDCLAALGDAGRAAYLRLFFIDLFYPAAYSALLASCLVLGARAVGREPQGARLALIPFAAALFDWSENVSFLALIRQWPASPPALVQAACVFNSGKWGLVMLSVVLALGALGLLISKRR